MNQVLHILEVQLASMEARQAVHTMEMAARQEQLLPLAQVAPLQQIVLLVQMAIITPVVAAGLALVITVVAVVPVVPLPIQAIVVLLEVLEVLDMVVLEVTVQHTRLLRKNITVEAEAPVLAELAMLKVLSKMLYPIMEMQHSHPLQAVPKRGMQATAMPASLPQSRLSLPFVVWRPPAHLVSRCPHLR